jgi:GNAT superfamily N-acetyltransferase
VSSDGVVLRRAKSSDAPALAALSGQLGYPVKVQQMASRLEAVLPDPSCTVLVAEDDDGSVVGWTHVRVERGIESEAFAEIRGLVVDERRRREGIGERLVSEAIHWAGERGDPGAVQHLRSAHRFYERQGSC